jgi:predicted ATPase
MLQRLYIHNFRCLENFELTLRGISSALLIGKNGTGKSTVAFALQILQRLGRGSNRVGSLLQPKDMARGRSDTPVRFEIEVLLKDRLYKYTLAIDLPENFKELRVCEEQLVVDNTPIYSRQEAQVTLYRSGQRGEAQFLVDWHLVALPIIQEHSPNAPIQVFKTWLAHTVVLAPIPALMTGISNDETLEPERDGSNLAAWFTGLLSRYPAAYTHIERYLREVMPDIRDFLNEPVGKDSKNLIVRFDVNGTGLSVDFKDLSDGEKCFYLCAVLLAANEFYGPLFCFWDEPDNYLSLAEVGHLITSLRRSFVNGSQILVASHNPEVIRKFSDENTLVLDRRNHLEPTLVRTLSEVAPAGDLVDALIRGDIAL